MAKKRKSGNTLKADQQKEKPLTLSDSLSDDLLSKLAAAKKELTAEATALEEERIEKKRREKEEKEKNKSFAELLDEYGDHGTKF